MREQDYDWTLALLDGDTIAMGQSKRGRKNQTTMMCGHVGNDTRMLRPREHSAQVPTDDQERLEREFKDRNS